MTNSSSEADLRKQKLLKLQRTGQDPFHRDFERKILINLLLQCNEASPLLLEDAPAITGVSGRIMQFRGFGKLIFAKLRDHSGTIQIMVDLERSGKAVMTQFKEIDYGDIIGINHGTLIRSSSGELTLLIYDFVLLAKALLPLPDKFHGLIDIEARYRKRYLDLIMNPEVGEVFRKRSLIIRTIRNYLDSLGYLEVETPILQSLLGGAAAKPFKTFHNSLKMPLYLRVAPELYLKRLVVGHFDKVYEIGRLFRNEGLSIKHNPEFTAIEIYQAYGNLTTMIELTENLCRKLVNEICGYTTITYQRNTLDFSKPFHQITMTEAVFKATKLDFNKITTFEMAKQLAKEHEIVLANHEVTVGHILNRFFEKYVEPTLIQPTFILEFPKVISPFAKIISDKPEFTQRFELFIGGREYANAFTELNDPLDQAARFEQQLAERKLGNEEANEIDHDYLTALQYGLPPTGGLGIGIDRLVMLLTDQASIKDVILFPTLRNK